MRNLWYVSVASASTAAGGRPMRAHYPPLTLAIVVALASPMALGACASSGTTSSRGSRADGPGAAGAAAGSDAVSSGAAAPLATGANLAGSRCRGGTCTCRDLHAGGAEDPPPDEGHKRFELRLGAEDGTATLESPTLGRFATGSRAGGEEACFTIDVVPGTTHDVTFVAREGRPEGGVGPLLGISEYGPKGPWWYDVLEVHCAGPGGKCNRDAAEDWSPDIKKRRRGRIDPCGSTVITHLGWDTSGGTGSRELGIFRDFSVTFTMEVKKFPTQFAPGSTECVPK
jgi:hypothetical protein